MSEFENTCLLCQSNYITSPFYLDFLIWSHQSATFPWGRFTFCSLYYTQSHPKLMYHYKGLCYSKCPNHAPSITIALSSKSCFVTLQPVIELRHTETLVTSLRIGYTDRAWASLSHSLTTTYLLYNLPDDSGYQKWRMKRGFFHRQHTSHYDMRKDILWDLAQSYYGGIA